MLKNLRIASILYSVLFGKKELKNNLCFETDLFSSMKVIDNLLLKSHFNKLIETDLFVAAPKHHVMSSIFH
jgi:hypothetical protein